MKQKTSDELIEAAPNHRITPEEHEAQRRSFAFGNVSIENPLVTRELVDEVAEQSKNVARSASAPATPSCRG